MSDSLHPNDAGYAVLGGAFYGANRGEPAAGPVNTLTART
jgi:hypothetical protein